MRYAIHSILASAMLLLVGLMPMLLGCTEAPVTSPELSAPLLQGADITASKVVASQNPVYTFGDLNMVGTSTLNRHGNSISMRLKTSQIPPGMAVTVWWVVFNNPEECQVQGNEALPGVACNGADLFNPAVQGDVLYAAGRVTGKGNHINYGGQLREADASDSVMGYFNALLGTDIPSVGLLDTEGAEVHLVVRTHQEKLATHMPDMIRTFNGGCTYPAGAPTDYGKPGPNTCSDIQFAVHQP